MVMYINNKRNADDITIDLITVAAATCTLLILQFK